MQILTRVEFSFRLGVCMGRGAIRQAWDRRYGGVFSSRKSSQSGRDNEDGGYLCKVCMAAVNCDL